MICIQVAGGALELDKPVKLFDMKKFQQNVARELKRAYPDRRKLECQVIMRMKMFLVIHTYYNYMLVCTIIGNTGKSSLIQRPDCLFVFSAYQQWLL